MGWAEHVASMGQRRGTFKIMMWRTDGNSNLEELDVGGRIILKCFFKK